MHDSGWRSHGWLILVALLASLAAGCMALRLGNSEAALVLEDVVTGMGDSRLKRRTETPERKLLRAAFGDATLHADLYRPASRARAGLVLVPGLTPAGKNDGRLVALARTLARAEFAVLVPDVPGFSSYRLRGSDVEVLVQAVRELAAQPVMQPGLPIGIGGFSYAVGPALMAALDPRVRERIDFVVGIGGYYDLRSLVAFYTTGARSAEYGGITPYDRGKWIFALGIAESLPVASDRLAVAALAQRMAFGRNDETSTSMPGNLSPGGAALVELLTNTTPERVNALIERLPRSLREEMKALNPAEADLDMLRARLLLLHGRADNIIPYGESVALAGALPPEQVRLFLIDGLAHVELSPEPDDIDILLEMVNALLAERVP